MLANGRQGIIRPPTQQAPPEVAFRGAGSVSERTSAANPERDAPALAFGLVAQATYDWSCSAYTAVIGSALISIVAGGPASMR